MKILPDWHEPYYNCAAAYGLMDKKDDMLGMLKKAVELRSELKTTARKDDRFEKYYEDPDFVEIVGTED